MPPPLALLLTTLFIAVLFYMDRKAFATRPIALWLPLIYAFILSSRLPSQWLQAPFSSSAYGAYQEGNSLDRMIFLGLFVSSVWVLLRRPQGLPAIMRAYFPLVLFLLYALVSVAWSDVPFIAFKRWIRDIGFYTTLCVVATEADVPAALRLFFRRLTYLVMPLSVLLIKYYPAMGRVFSYWTGQAYETGIATSKNGLGATALVCGLFLVWDTFANVRNSAHPRRQLSINAVLLTMAIWLLSKSDSATSTLCFAIGTAYLAFVYLTPGRISVATLNRVFIGTLLLFFPLDAIFGLTELVLGGIGRDATLTDRTNVWSAVLAQVPVPLIGAGYESFWTGSRMLRIWEKFNWGPNQAHNGYIEVYANLGWIGLFLIITVLLTAYWNISKSLVGGPEFSRFAMALFMLFAFYNYTEAALKAHLMWFAVLVTAMSARPVTVSQLQPAIARRVSKTSGLAPPDQLQKVRRPVAPRPGRPSSITSAPAKSRILPPRPS